MAKKKVKKVTKSPGHKVTVTSKKPKAKTAAKK